MYVVYIINRGWHAYGAPTSDFKQAVVLSHDDALEVAKRFGSTFGTGAVVSSLEDAKAVQNK